MLKERYEMQECHMKVTAEYYQIPPYGTEQFEDFCAEHDLTIVPPEKGKAYSSKADAYIEDRDFIIYMKEFDAWFFARKELLRVITLGTVKAEQLRKERGWL